MNSGNVLTIFAKTDWFVDPFERTVAKNAPILTLDRTRGAPPTRTLSGRCST
jgi:hypothetical protein